LGATPFALPQGIEPRPVKKRDTLFNKRGGFSRASRGGRKRGMGGGYPRNQQQQRRL